MARAAERTGACRVDGIARKKARDDGTASLFSEAERKSFARSEDYGFDDPIRTWSVHRDTQEVVLDFERPANVKLATDRHVRAWYSADYSTGAGHFLSRMIPLIA